MTTNLQALEAQQAEITKQIEALQAKQAEIAKQIEAVKTAKKATKTTKKATKRPLVTHIIKPDTLENELTEMVNELTTEQLTKVWQKLGFQVHPKFTKTQLKGVLLASNTERVHEVISTMM